VPKVLSTLAVQGALPSLATPFEQTTGINIATDFAPTKGLLTRIKGGETGDVAILTREGIDELARLGIVDNRSIVDLVRSLVGIGVKVGSARPDIGSPEALKGALLAAKSIAYSKIGASGVFFAGLIDQLGIADAINAKATIIPSGLTGQLAARGEVELAVQQLSELKLVAGIDVIGPLPAALQTPTIFSAAVFARSARASEARAFLQALTSAEAGAAFTSAGLEPVR
jgi:molybdate transport system substrate-binding protein